MRAALYARVSTEEQVEGYSLDAQRRAFREFCQSKDWIIAEEYVEEGRSAHTEDMRTRPIFKQAIDAALDHRFDVLVVHKIDRFSRKLKVTLETFDKLHKAGVGFVSISEQMDFFTPTGQVFLAMVGAFSQFYSDNLSHETKKGWAERRAQGLYCGPLPFGVMKGEDGIPCLDDKNHLGLVLAFEQSSKGKTDREVAIDLNNAGYRTTGTHGPRPFSKETVKDMLSNRFYIGEIQDGHGGWLKALHPPLIEPDLFLMIQDLRQRRRRHRLDSVRAKGTTYSLSGLARCAVCGARMHMNRDRLGRPRVYCYGRAQGGPCDCRCTLLSAYESQIEWYLSEFRIPDDYQDRILADFTKLQHEGGSTEQRSVLVSRLKRLKDMYGWGHLDRNDYLQQHDQLQRELAALDPRDTQDKTLCRLAAFLANIAGGWRAADQKQRNQLACALFEEVWIEDNRVTRVRPLPELEPFFRLNHDGPDDPVSSTRRPDPPPGRHFIFLRSLSSKAAGPSLDR